jgi:ABC-type glycerol-3-phosphate transport system substrate-binding protein
MAAEFVTKSGVRQTQWGLDLTPLTYFWSTAGFVLAWGGLWYSAVLHSVQINNDGSASLFLTVQNAIFKTSAVIKGSTFPAGTDSLATGQVAMVLDGSWATLQHRNDIGNRFDWEVAPMPKGPTGKLPLSEAGGAWSIATDSTHPNEAWTWIKFLTNTQSEEILVSEPVRSMPGRRSAVALWISTAKSYKLPPAHASVFADVLPDSYNVPSVPYYQELADLSSTYIGNIMTLNKPVKATLAAWQTAANSAIKKYKF